jgi:hypothetical protein
MYSLLLTICGNGGGEVMDNSKPQLKRKQFEHNVEWI